MNTLEFVLDLPSTDQDRYLARLARPANGFWQGDAELRAYIPADRWSASDTEKLKADLAADGYQDALTVRVVESKNWNAVWEDTLSPVRAGPFLVVPASGDPPTGERDAIVLRIDPEMSFGTGHHATTRLALQLLATAIDPGDRMLDVGTGTGILAIAACRSGAQSALGIDTAENAVRNALENVRRNEVDSCVAIEHGSVEAVPNTTYDVVTANITRRVLRTLLPDLQPHLETNGTLILSGILDGKHRPLVETLSARGLSLEDTATEDGWWAAHFTSAK